MTKQTQIRVMLGILIALIFILNGCTSLDLASSIDVFYDTSFINATPTPTPTPRPTPTSIPTASPTLKPTPTLTPKPTLTPSPTLDIMGGELVKERFNQEFGIYGKIDLEYDRYATYPAYFVVKQTSYIRELPSKSSDKIYKVRYPSKLQIVASVELEDDTIWYAVQYHTKSKTYEGFISEDVGYTREFQTEVIFSRANALKQLLESGNAVFVNNYKNTNGYAPKLSDGSTTDEFNNRRAQAAPGYYTKDTKAEFRYIPDGMLGSVEQISNDLVKIYIPSFDTSLWVPIKYLSLDEDDVDKLLDKAIVDYNKNNPFLSLNMDDYDVAKYLNDDTDSVVQLTQIIVVDRKNQNIVVLEYDQEWEIISLNYSSTGKTGVFSLPTPLGDFMAQQRRSKFDYYQDGTSIISGYAPYAIRFSAGGYLHGVPRLYIGGVPQDHIESLSNLGTTPQSHMCVRNYTSHAKFMYDWVDIGECAVIVIE